MKMQHSYRWVILCACALVGAGAACLALWFFTAAARSQLNLASTSELDPSDPKYKEVMCGPVSLSVALGRLGINKLPADVASQCRVTSQGVALRDLEHVANSTRLVSACARRLTWEELSRLDGVAVLFVKGSHFLAADPRPAPPGAAETATVRIYEPARPVQQWTREKLEEIWGGEALVINRRAAGVDEVQGGACIDWEECFIDQGVLRNTPRAHYRFSFRNVGSSELVIGEIQRSCGCSKQTLSQKRLAPGQSAVLEAEVDLHGTEGYFQHYVAIQTNDATSPLSILRMAGGVPRVRVLSSDVIRTEDLPQGGKASQRFYVGDPGFSGVKIREARFVPPSSSAIGKHLSCVVSYDLLGEEAQRVAVGFRARPSDYVVQLTFEASTVCPLGLFQGEVRVVLEADGIVTTHKVVIEGMIVLDVYPVPRVALITLDSEGTGRATIQLHSHLKKGVGVVRMWSDSPNSLKIQPKGQSRAAIGEYMITAQVSDVIAGAAPLQRAVFFELDDGSVRSVPVALFRPPQ